MVYSQQLIDDLLNYSDSKGRHILWKKRNVLCLRQKIFTESEFSTSDLAKRVFEVTSFLPIDIQLEYRVKAIMQGIDSYGKCIICGNDAHIAKSLSFKDPFFSKFCTSKSCLTSYMSRSRVTTDASRLNHSISMSKYKRQLDDAYMSIKSKYEEKSFNVVDYREVVDYARLRILSQKGNGSLVPHNDILNNQDLICSIIFHTYFIDFNEKKKGISMLSLPERLFCLSKELKATPTCKFCGGPVKFFSVKHGYIDSCRKCIGDKIRKTHGLFTTQECIDSIDKEKYEVIEVDNSIEAKKNKHLTVKCKRCGNTTTLNIASKNINYYIQNGHLCKHCDTYFSKDEKEVRAAIEHLVGLGQMSVNDRTLISPYELDIVVPSYNIAVEFNGMHWHNENIVKKNYHQLKTIKCEKVGYRLIHIFEDQWHSNKKLCIGILRRAFGKSRVIDAHKCEAYIGSFNDSIANFMKKYTFNYTSRLDDSLFMQFYYKSHLVACIEFYYRSSQKAVIIQIAQMNNFEVHNLAQQACIILQREVIELVVPHDIYKAEDFLKQGFAFKKYVSSIGRWTCSGKSMDICKIKENPHKCLKHYDPKKTLEENFVANRYARVYDSGTIVLDWCNTMPK